MSLSRLIAGFVRQHWPAYAAAAVMLTGVATLTVWIPRRVGAIIDALAAHRMTAAELWLELLTLYRKELEKGWHDAALRPLQPKSRDYRGHCQPSAA